MQRIWHKNALKVLLGTGQRPPLRGLGLEGLYEGGTINVVTSYFLRFSAHDGLFR